MWGEDKSSPTIEPDFRRVSPTWAWVGALMAVCVSCTIFQPSGKCQKDQGEEAAVLLKR